MKKTVSLLLCLCLMLSMVPGVFAADAGLGNFTRQNTYVAGQFTDVAAGIWYEASVKDSFEYGLVKGKSDTTFVPDGNITLAEVFTLAARIHSIYNTGKAEFVQGSPWYQVYLNYCVENGIMDAGDYMDFTVPATRSQCALILASAVPAEELKAINNITAIPDVEYASYGWANAVYLLYNAGVLTGSDKYGTFNPLTNIKRSEIAAIVTRIVDPSVRKSFVPEVEMVTLFSADDRVIQVNAGQVEQYLKLGWYREHVGLRGTSGVYTYSTSLVAYDYGSSCMYLSGAGEIGKSYDFAVKPWAAYAANTYGLYIGRGIDTVGSFAFDAYPNLNHVEIGDNVTKIDSYAFTGCDNITRLGIPSSVTYIHYKALDTEWNGNDYVVTSPTVVYCEAGSYAESWAKEYGLSVVHATPVYYPDGRSMMVSAAERGLYVSNGWYTFPVTTLYLADGRSMIIAESLAMDYINVGWSDRVCAAADAEIAKNGFEAGVVMMENALKVVKSNHTMYPAYTAKKTTILNNWRATVGQPLAITNVYITYNSINVPEVNITFRNLTNKTITSLESTWLCVDAYGNATADFSHLNGYYTGWMDSDSIAPGASETYYWTLYNYERTSSIKYHTLDKCAFSDGTTWYRGNWYY